MLHFPFIRSHFTQTFSFGIFVNFSRDIIRIFAYLRHPFFLQKYTKTTNNISKMANTREHNNSGGDGGDRSANSIATTAVCLPLA